MSKKLFTLITSIVGAVSAAASAIIGYIHPSGTTAIIASIGVANTAIMEILNLFVKAEETIEEPKKEETQK